MWNGVRSDGNGKMVGVWISREGGLTAKERMGVFEGCCVVNEMF